MIEMSAKQIEKLKRKAKKQKEQREQRPPRKPNNRLPKKFPTHVSAEKVEKMDKVIRNKVYHKEYLVTYLRDNSFICGEDIEVDGVVVYKTEKLSTVRVTIDFFDKIKSKDRRDISDFNLKEVGKVKSLRLNCTTKLQGVTVKRIL